MPSFKHSLSPWGGRWGAGSTGSLLQVNRDPCGHSPQLSTASTLRGTEKGQGTRGPRGQRELTDHWFVRQGSLTWMHLRQLQERWDFILNRLLLRSFLDLHKNWADHTESTSEAHTQFPLSLAPYISMVCLLSLMNEYWCIIINSHCTDIKEQEGILWTALYL